MLDLGPLDDLEDLDDFDENDDGQVSITDCPYKPGSVEAILWAKKLDVAVHSQDAIDDLPDDVKDQYGDKITGAFNGKALIPGESGPNQGDFDYLVQQLQAKHGFDQATASKVAGSIKMKLGR